MHSFVILCNCFSEESCDHAICILPCRTYSLIVTYTYCATFAIAEAVEPKEDLAGKPEVDQGEIAALEELLGLKLAEFLSADYSCSLSQLASSVRPHLYKGPSSFSKVNKKLTTSLTLLSLLCCPFPFIQNFLTCQKQDH